MTTTLLICVPLIAVMCIVLVVLALQDDFGHSVDPSEQDAYDAQMRERYEVHDSENDDREE